MNWSLLGRLFGHTNPRSARIQRGENNARNQNARKQAASRRRSIRVESLERRDLLAYGDLPFGAMPDDLGEYMLGDIRVNVVFLESDPTMTKRDGSPADNGSITYVIPTNPPTNPPTNQTYTYSYPVENWSNWTQGALDNLRGKIASGLSWWEQTLRNKFPKAPTDALRFSIDWTHADNPVETAYEPIARISDDFQYWIYDFLGSVGFDAHAATRGFSPDVRAFNNTTRTQANSDWSFTIFVVNDLNDPNDRFTQFSNQGSFKWAFAFPGGQFMVVPASRGFEAFAHETGHMFWGLDEYLDDDDWVFNPTPPPGRWEKTQLPDEYLERRGYYNTQNWNAADNPTAGFVQEDSIMSADDPAAGKFPMSRAGANRTSPRSTLEMVGWDDDDDDGIMNVLDVPFELIGAGQYDINSGRYFFNGSTKVRTLPNLNPAGLQNDITINQIRAVDYSVDGGVTWQRHQQTFPTRTYQTALSLNFEVPDGQTTVKIRTVDTRTGVKSNEFVGVTDGPTPLSPGISGFVFSDDDGDGNWDTGEAPLPDYGIEVLDQSGNPLDLLRWVEPDDWDPLTALDNVTEGATLSAFGFDTGNLKSVVALKPSPASTNLVFATTNNLNQYSTRWNEARRLRVDFSELQSNVSLHAYGGSAGSNFARLEAYDAGGALLERLTSQSIAPNTLRLMALARPSADVAYVVAFGHNSDVMLDTLEWGPASSTTSDFLGAYSLNTLPDGVYQVQVTAPSPNHIITTPPGGIAFVTVAGGLSAGGVNFGVHFDSNEPPRFHNAPSPRDVSNDAGNVISAFDAILVINWLNAHPGQSAILQTADPNVIGFIDVDGNGTCTPNDAIQVINFLNRPPASPPPPGGESAGLAGTQGNTLAASALTSAGTKPGSGAARVAFQPSADETSRLAAAQAAYSAAAEGEGNRSSGPPRTAAEYYAQNPLHFDEIPGTELPCSCATCLPAQLDASQNSSELDSAVAAIAADMAPTATDQPTRFSLRLLTAKGR